MCVCMKEALMLGEVLDIDTLYTLVYMYVNIYAQKYTILVYILRVYINYVICIYILVYKYHRHIYIYIYNDKYHYSLEGTCMWWIEV